MPGGQEAAVDPGSTAATSTAGTTSREDSTAEGATQAKWSYQSNPFIPRDVAEIVVVRHGETTWNRENRMQGQTESDLSDAGRAQARALAARFASGYLPFAAAYSSDLRRAAETAEVVVDAVGMRGEEVLRLKGLRERSLGVLEGLIRDEALRKHPEAYLTLASKDWSQPIPGGGESLEDMYGRVTAAVNHIAKEHLGQRVLLVTHGGVCNCIHMKASGNRHAKKVYNTSIGIVRVSPPGKWTILRWADVEHLKAVDYDKQAFGGGADSG
ncbi:hypothetical protein CLOM_g9745 [Closterium sp. NIES-68]|nr:hypothetical protein CLOM_g9745 [Closterium sp. NIES-68]